MLRYVTLINFLCTSGCYTSTIHRVQYDHITIQFEELMKDYYEDNTWSTFMTLITIMFFYKYKEDFVYICLGHKALDIFCLY